MKSIQYLEYNALPDFKLYILLYFLTCMWNLLKTQPAHRKRDQICGYPRAGVGGRKLEEGGQKVQASSYKINKYCRCNVQQDKYNEHCCMLYTKVV